jgi:signal transduction histidine kinase
MNVLEAIAVQCSPYPLVQIDSPRPPIHGRHYATPKFCHKMFGRGECEKFYRSLRQPGVRYQCPYGFSVWLIRLGSSCLAATATIGAPRMGGSAERLRAKEYPANRIDADEVLRWAEEMNAIVSRGDVEREEEFARRLEALHEIRRFNQIVKTNMERACTKVSPIDPDDAPVELVRAHRASSLISLQLDALDLLANPASAMSFSPRRWVFYRTVDKLVRIYKVLADNRNVRLRLLGSSVSEALLDERTIHIIPSVFIDNAVKYSETGGPVDVRVSEEIRDGRAVISVEVTSNGPVASEDEEKNLFRERGRGKAARGISEGSGIGLTLAKIVSDQHGGWISAKQKRLQGGRAEWNFKFQLPRV